MSGQSPWSVKGVEPRTREAAKDLARREGLTLGELLNRLIAETDEPTQKPVINAKSAINFGQEANRLTAALEQLSRRLESGGVELVPPMPSPGVDDRLSQKFEKPVAAGDTAVGRIETHLNDLRETQVVLSERLRRIESQDPTHASLAALKSLESALSRLATQVFETDSRVSQIEKVTQEAIQTVDQSLGLVAERLATTEALAQETNHRFVEAMIDLSARLTGLEEVGERAGGPDVSVLEDRLSQLEDITSQTLSHTVEVANQGINQVTERVHGIETYAQDNASRMVEALVDLSARLTQLEGAGKTGDTLTAVEALEAKTNEFSARLNELTAEIEAARADLHGQVQAALSSGINGQMTEVAQALASRLDASEQRSQDAYDRVSAKFEQATQALDSRLAQVENRESTPDQTGSMAMKLELARITRGIDERLSSIERHDASVMEQTGQHIQRLAQSLGDRIDASERQSAESIATISKQMQELADRLAVNHDKAVQGLATTFNESDSKTRQLLDEALGQVRSEVQSVDARVQALIAPLQQDFVALGDRLDKAEQGALSAYAEPIFDPNHSVDLGGPAGHNASSVKPVAQSGEDGFSFESRGDSLEKPKFDDPFVMDSPTAKTAAASAAANPARRGSFGSPFPDGEDSEHLNDFADLRDDVPDPLAGGLDPFGGEVDAMVLDPTRPIDDDSDDGLSSLDHDWDGPNSKTSSAPDYLVAARRAANQAAAAREAAQTKKKPTLSLKGPAGKEKKAEAAKAKPSAKPQAPQAVKDAKEGGKPKSPLSPVGIAAAAALVATGGFAVYSQLKPSSNVDEKPAALNQENVPLPPELAAQAAIPAPVEGAVPMPATEVAEVPTTAASPTPTPTVAATAATAAAAPIAAAATAARNIPSPPPQLPKAQLVTPTTKASVAAPASPPAKPSPTPQQIEAARIMASADAQARAARARAEAQRDRLRSPTFKAARADAPPRPVQRPTPPRVATVAKASTSSAAAPPRVASVAASALATTAAAAAPTRVPVTPTAATPGAPAASPPVASAATAATGSLFDQAMAREQAGDGAGSVALLRRAADGGDTRAMNRLARKFETGDGVTKDLAQARALTERAAARGSRQAMHNLGVYYANGDGVPQNMARAAESFRRAAQRGVTDSQFNLGAMAEQGLGGPKSDVQAYYWFALAARGGDQDALAKVREIGARLTPEQKAAQDQLVAKFRPDGGSPD